MTTTDAIQRGRLNEQVAQLKVELDLSQYTVVITGAGISMGAGIKDMEHMNIAQVAQTALEPLVRLHPERSYRLLRKSFLKAMFSTGPSIAHTKIAELEKQKKVHGVITTNIDHLHTLAGSRNVAEIQGSYAINRCVSCKVHENDVHIWNRGEAPRCRECNGVMVSFPVYSRVGVHKPDYAKASRWVSDADLVLAVGSKGMYGQYLEHLNRRAKVIQINPKSTQFDSMAVLSIRAEADEVFTHF